ncbi:unnamed protein product [Cylindrotheca closterium]|uniref:Uncharacterized protein n=1 Tax=Cylindrotheca closterium TaxID=2856 RepID=A0AAD2FWJ2_9STRA|nr:unnamed protein product [Cylindrotheca closterium]
MGLDIQFSVHSNEGSRSLAKPHQLSNGYPMALDHDVLDIHDDDDADDAFIMDAKYEATSGAEVADKQKHLTEDQRKLLAQALKNTDEIFNGQLGHYKHEKAYSVLKQHEPVFLKELKHLQEIGVLERTGPSDGRRQHSAFQKRTVGCDGSAISDS